MFRDVEMPAPSQMGDSVLLEDIRALRSDGGFYE